MSSNSVWVVISANKAQERLIRLIDAGQLAEAVGRNQALEALVNKIKSFTQQYGGYLPIAVFGRIVMQIPSSAAEQVPNIIEGFSDSLGNKIAVGIGMTFDEAAKAARASEGSGRIEMFDPEGNMDSDDDDFEKSALNGGRRLSSNVTLPVNLFNPLVPDDSEVKETLKPKDSPPKLPSLEESMQSESQLLQMLAMQMGGGQPQPSPEQMQGQQPQQQVPARSLLEALNGAPVQGSSNESQGAPQGAPTEDVPAEGEVPEQEISQEVNQAEDEAASFDKKLAGILHNVKNQIPQIMALSDKDPKAFKQTMQLIQKLIQTAHSGKSKSPVEKSEMRQEIEELEKSFNKRLSYFRGFNRPQHLPLHSRKGKFKKVLVNGKEVWREMSAGQVQDDKGEPISVESSNLGAQGK